MGVHNIIVNGNGSIMGSIYQGNSGYMPEEDCQKKKEREVVYDVAVSYAGEQEEFAGRVVKILRKEGLEVFFAQNCEKEYKAKDMFEKFYDIYRYRSGYVVCFLSKEYLQKDYTMHEYESAYLKRKDVGENRTIVVSLDGSLPEHMDKDINYIDAKGLKEVQVAACIMDIVR